MSQSPFRRALQNAGWLLAGKGVGAVLSLIYLGLATRSMGIERFGQFTLILSTGQAIAGFVTFQSWQIVVRYGVGLLAAAKIEALGRLERSTILIDLAAALVGCAIAAIAVALLGARLGWSPALRHEALWFCFVLLLTTRSTAVGILRLHDQFRTGAAADAVTPIARFLGAIAAVLNGATVYGFLLAWAIAEVVTALVYWIAAYRTDRSFVGRPPGVAAVLAENPGIGRFALTVNVNATLNAGSKQLLIVLIGVVAGPVAAGAYRLAFQLSQAMTRLADMFSRAIFPEFTRADVAEIPSALHRLYRQTTRFTLATGIIICLLAPIAGRPILALVGGSAYADVYAILVLLSIATALEVMSVGYEPLLLGTGQTREILWVRLISTVILFAIAGVTLARFGAIAAAGSSLFASAMALTGLMIFARRAIRRRG